MVRSICPSILLAVGAAVVGSTTAFVPSSPISSFAVRSSQLFSTEGGSAADAAKEIEISDRRNPDRPELPELKGDFDWDERYKGDDDWITENVPGKVVLNEVELAAQVTALSKLEEKWRKERVQKEYEKERLLGWTAQAETYNGRFAMFFLVVGLLTEYWTGVSIPGQIEEMLRVGGFIGFDQ